MGSERVSERGSESSSGSGWVKGTESVLFEHIKYLPSPENHRLISY